LNLKSVRTYYGNIEALKEISLTVSEGEIITLIGANGAGKSTTLMSISGIVPPRFGEILFLDKPIHHLNPDEIVTLGISQVPEGRRIFPQLTVLENLDMGAFLRKDSAGIKKDMDHIFALFPIWLNGSIRVRYAEWRGTADAGYFPGVDGEASPAADG